MTAAKTAVDDASRASGLWQASQGTAEGREFLVAVMMGDRPDKKDEDHIRYTFIASFPRWLMTFTAMRPVEGLPNGPRGHC